MLYQWYSESLDSRQRHRDAAAHDDAAMMILSLAVPF